MTGPPGLATLLLDRRQPSGTGVVMFAQVIYTSFARDASGAKSDVALLDSARRNNPRLGLTGYLFRTSRCFVQLLEGPRAQVEGMMQVISNDPRHHDLYTWPMVETSVRSFPDWSMGYDDVLQDRDTRLVHELRTSGLSFAALRTHIEVMAQP